MRSVAATTCSFLESLFALEQQKRFSRRFMRVGESVCCYIPRIILFYHLALAYSRVKYAWWMIFHGCYTPFLFKYYNSGAL